MKLYLLDMIRQETQLICFHALLSKIKISPKQKPETRVVCSAVQTDSPQFNFSASWIRNDLLTESREAGFTFTHHCRGDDIYCVCVCVWHMTDTDILICYRCVFNRQCCSKHSHSFNSVKFVRWFMCPELRLQASLNMFLCPDSSSAPVCVLVWAEQTSFLKDDETEPNLCHTNWKEAFIHHEREQSDGADDGADDGAERTWTLRFYLSLARQQLLWNIGVSFIHSPHWAPLFSHSGL